MKLSKTYDAGQYEPSVYTLWETADAFSPTGVGEPYSIVMPPPNANGNLHVGHALMADLEDILARFYRMQGRDVAYIPGADHAGFETWVVYERELNKQGKSRTDFSRTELYSQVWDFVAAQRGSMEAQLRALGAGASWNDLVFTLDEKVTQTVYGTFKKLWDDGLIYRGERIVNYSTTFQTSYADIEVDHKIEKGTLWNIAYPSIDKIKEVVVATTRPETMFGDTALAVHPEDPRYKDLIGTKVLVPLTDREIPVIGDEYVDSNFGTGVVKITPAHDPNDFEVGNRHNLPRIQVIDYDGTMINVPPEYMKQSPEVAREKVVAALTRENLLRGETVIEHSVGYDYKSDKPIQPMLKDQWFLKVAPLVEKAKAAIEAGEITFYPESKKNALLSYYDNLKDWNLSRQIPWGMPIPAFQNTTDPSDWRFDIRVDQPTIDIDGVTYAREEDTFDTWFSSGQWPFITTDYLQNGELARFYPNSVLETGYDILFPWVSRMIMLGIYATGQVPFKDVYLHGLVLDAKGIKMSKSKGNVINPMDLVEKYGSDALRLGIVAARGAGQNQAFSVDRVITGRNFCNKLWNIARFIEDKLGDDFVLDGSAQADTLADHWITKRLSDAATTIPELIKNYRFAEASETIYHTIWDDVADWYVEASKKQDNPQLLAWVLDTSLRIAHPFAPFVTETIWQTLGWHDKELLVSASWPEAKEYSELSAAAFEQLQELVGEVRFVVSELPGNKRYRLFYGADSLIADNTELIQHLAKLISVEQGQLEQGLPLAVANREAWLDVDQETLYEHQTNQEVRLAEARTRRGMLAGRLNNANYLDKAPEHLVEETRTELRELEQQIERLTRELEVIE